MMLHLLFILIWAYSIPDLVDSNIPPGPGNDSLTVALLALGVVITSIRDIREIITFTIARSRGHIDTSKESSHVQ